MGTFEVVCVWYDSAKSDELREEIVRFRSKKYLAVAAISLCGSLAQGQMTGGPNVSGISLGMSLSQAKSILGPSFSYITPTTNDPAFIALLAGKGDVDKSLLEGFLVVALDGKIVHIGHQVLAQKNQPFSVDQLKSSLLEKYGKTASTPVRYSTINWLFGKDGKVSPDRSPNFDPCFFSSNDVIVSDTQVPGVPDNIDDNMALGFNLQPQPGCGSLVMAIVESTGYKVQITNMDVLAAYAAGKDREAKQKRQADEEAARRRKAPM